MKIIFFAFFLLFSTTIFAYTPSAAMGVETGVARLSDGDNSAIGTSWMFHFEYNIDPIVGFFGQAGNSSAKDGNKEFSQNAFGGGLLLTVMPVMEVRLGLASTVLEIDDGNKTNKEIEMGPLLGATVFVTEGVWKLGTSATIIRTGNLQSASARLFLLLMF